MKRLTALLFKKDENPGAKTSIPSYKMPLLLFCRDPQNHFDELLINFINFNWIRKKS